MTPNSNELTEEEERAYFRDLYSGRMLVTEPQMAVDLRVERTWNRIKRANRRRFLNGAEPEHGYIYELFQRHFRDSGFIPAEKRRLGR